MCGLQPSSVIHRNDVIIYINSGLLNLPLPSLGPFKSSGVFDPSGLGKPHTNGTANTESNTTENIFLGNKLIDIQKFSYQANFHNSHIFQKGIYTLLDDILFLILQIYSSEDNNTFGTCETFPYSVPQYVILLSKDFKTLNSTVWFKH